MADGDFFGIGGGLLGNGGAGFNPAQMGLLQAGLALMQSRPGEGFGGALGRAGQAGIGGYMQSQRQAKEDEYDKLRSGYIAAQTDGLKAKQAKDTQVMGLLAPLFGGGQQPGMPQGGAAQSMPVQMPGMEQGLLSGGAMGEPQGGLLSSMQSPSAQQMPQIPQQMPMQAPQQQMPGMQQGGFPFTLPQVMAIHAAGGPDLLPAYKYATDGVKRDAGAYYVNPMTGQREYNPKLGEGMTLGANNQVSALPGYANSNAQIQGMQAGAVTAAQEGAKFPYVGPSEAARQAAQYPYQVGAMREGAALDPMQVVGPNGDMVYANRLGVAQGGMPGGQGGMPGGMRAAINPVSQDAAKNINSDWITNSYRPTLESGKAASDLSNSLQAFRGVDLQTGWGTEVKAQAASILGALGVKDAEKYAGEAQKFQSVAMDRLLNNLKEQKGSQTEGDSTRAQKTFALLGNTPQANAFIADMAQAQANQQQRKAAFYEAALPLAQRDGDLTKVDREWRRVAGSIWNDPILAQYPRGR